MGMEAVMVITEDLSLEEKLTILTDAAKYDVACTSSGVDRKGLMIYQEHLLHRMRYVN